MTTTTNVDNIPGVNDKKIDAGLGVVGNIGGNFYSTEGVWLQSSTINFVECPFIPSGLIIQGSYINTTDDDFWFEAKIQKLGENICYFNDAELEELNSTTSNSIEIGNTKKTVGQISFKTNGIEVDLQPNAYFDIKWTITFF